jgi:hypothetical protein
MGDITTTAYYAQPFQETISGPAIIAVEAGAALRPNAGAGTPTTAPARRVTFLANDDASPAELTADYLKMLDAAVNWASSGGTNLTIGYATNDGDPTGSQFDEFWQSRLMSQGHTIINLAQGDNVDAVAPNAHMFILSDNATSGELNNPVGEYSQRARPIIHFEQALNDELGTADAGAERTIGSVQITTPAHPIAAGLTGTVVIANPPQDLMHVPGNDVAPGGTVVARFESTGAGLIDTLADADAMRAGTIPSNMFTGMISQADIWDSDPTGVWTFDNLPPGSPGASDDFAVFNTGTLNVTQAGTYHFAISGDDGGRLRIDKNGDMVLNNADNVIVDDTLHAIESRFGSLELNPGTYRFEWVGFERGGGASFELSVAVSPDPFTGDNGTFFTGADMDDGFGGGASATNPRRITTRAINVAGAQNLQVSVDLAASPPGPWEDVDFLRVLVDPDASGPSAPIQLKEFRGGSAGNALASGADVLDDMFRNFTFPLAGIIPANAQQVSLIVESLSTAADEQVGIENLRLLGTLAGLVGDYNGNRVVDAADYVVWRKNVGGDASALAAGSRDPANTGPIGQGDYNSWRANFGRALGVGGAGAVPEPITAWLIASGLALLLFTRRRAV